jgi:hypothetical protein
VVDEWFNQPYQPQELANSPAMKVPSEDKPVLGRAPEKRPAVAALLGGRKPKTETV